MPGSTSNHRNRFGFETHGFSNQIPLRLPLGETLLPPFDLYAALLFRRAASMPDLSPPPRSGSICIIRGLTSRTDLNEHIVLVGDYDSTADRFVVEDVTSPTGSVFRVGKACLTLKDPVLQKTNKALGDMAVCHVYCEKLLQLSCTNEHARVCQWPAWPAHPALASSGLLLRGILEAVAHSPGDHHLVLLNLNAVAHQCTLEVGRYSVGYVAHGAHELMAVMSSP